MKSRPSTLMPSSNGRFAAASTHWMMYSGARNPRDFLAIEARNAANNSVLPLACGNLVVAVANTQQRQVLGDRLRGERHRGCAQCRQVTVDHVVDEPRLQRLGGADVAARGHHLQCLGHTGQAGEPLGAAAAGEQAEVDLGEAELRRRHGDAVVSGQCSFESATECGAVDRGDHGDRRVLHGGLHFVESDGLLGAAAELGDVGAGDERATVADHDDTLRAVVDRLGQSVEQALADVPAQRVDGRVVDDDHGDVADVARLGLDADGFGHCSRFDGHGASQAPDPARLRFRVVHDYKGSDP